MYAGAVLPPPWGDPNLFKSSSAFFPTSFFLLPLAYVYRIFPPAGERRGTSCLPLSDLERSLPFLKLSVEEPQSYIIEAVRNGEIEEQLSSPSLRT